MVKKIILLGPYPEPYGGVSIHIKRLKERILKNDIRCVVYDNSGVFKKENNVIALENTTIWFLSQLLHTPDSIIHFHGYSPKLITLLSFLKAFKRKKIIITLHSFRYDIEDLKLPDKFAFALSKRYGVHFITVGSEIKKKIILLGIRPENLDIIPGFLPPFIRKEESAEIPQEIWKFISNHIPIISANAFKIVFYKGQDLYGIDMCIDLCANLRQNYPKIGFVFCLPDIGDYKYFNKMKLKIKEKKLEDNFLFQTKPCELYPVIMKSNVFVRPTITDSYGVSVAEAMHFKIPAVASDVCIRPEGTILFKNRDINDFTIKVKNVLDNYEKYKSELARINFDDNFERILQVYNQLMGEV